MWKFFSQKTDKNFYQELEKKNIGQLFFKVANNWFDRTNALWWLTSKYVVLVLPGSVETQLGWMGKCC